MQRAELTEMKAFFEALVGKLPLFSGLRNSTWAGHGEAFVEFVFFWSLSLLPMLFSVAWDILHNLKTIPSWAELGIAFLNNLKFGEVFIYANALLGPVAFVIYKHNRDRFQFPNHLSFFWLLLFTLPLSAFIYALQRAQTVSNTAILVPLAIGIYLIAVLLRYLSLVYDHCRADFLKTTRNQEVDLVNDLRKFHSS